MTYRNLVKRGWFCRCKPHQRQVSGHDTWDGWKLCGQCRLPIEGSNKALIAESGKRSAERYVG